MAKNNISKLPYNELKSATLMEQKRELMQLQILDVRLNPMLSGTIPKTLKQTVILAWDNSMVEQTTKAVVQKSEIT